MASAEILIANEMHVCRADDNAVCLKREEERKISKGPGAHSDVFMRENLEMSPITGVNT